jgi:hypothetical protein
MYVMPNSTASDAAPESAQSDFPHSLEEFRPDREGRGEFAAEAVDKKYGRNQS